MLFPITLSINNTPLLKNIAMKLQNIPNNLSRRTWLRDAAITATGAALMPSLLTGCTDHLIPPDVGVGDAPLTNAELRAAAQNLLHMNAWVEDVYLYTGNYEGYILPLLKSGEKPSGWGNFILSILTDIAIGIIGVAAAGVPGLGPAIGAAVAIVSENIKKWALGDRPGTLDAEFAEFKIGHLKMQKAISDMLLTLADETDNYRNLQEGWKGNIDLNGKKYTLRDLAASQFPTVDKGAEFVALRTLAYDRFKKYIWNVMILKAGSMTYSAQWSFNENFSHPGVSPTAYGRDEHYKNYPATYLRGGYSNLFNLYYFRYWYLTFDDRELSADAAKELFKDDTPENIINHDGLFNRDYVFKQFHREKPDFFGYHDLRKDSDYGPNRDDAQGFDLPDDFSFTGGDFPQLIKK